MGVMDEGDIQSVLLEQLDPIQSPVEGAFSIAGVNRMMEEGEFPGGVLRLVAL
jgi:hypothetical protein